MLYVDQVFVQKIPESNTEALDRAFSALRSGESMALEAVDPFKGVHNAFAVVNKIERVVVVSEINATFGQNHIRRRSKKCHFDVTFEVIDMDDSAEDAE